MARLQITGFDHLVLRCLDVETSLNWYVDVLGLEEWREGAVPFPSVRLSAETIIDLIPADGPVAERNVDHFCVVADRASVDAVAAGNGTLFNVVAGPVTRFGAKGDGWSVYVTDPDENMIEIRTYDG